MYQFGLKSNLLYLFGGTPLGSLRDWESGCQEKNNIKIVSLRRTAGDLNTS